MADPDPQHWKPYNKTLNIAQVDDKINTKNYLTILFSIQNLKDLV